VNKKQLVDTLIHQLASEMELIASTAKSAFDEATHEDELNKNQFETPGLETSVLAEGQVKVAAELREALDTLQELPVHDFAPGDAIGLGALVETEAGDDKYFYFVAPKGGGLEVEVDGTVVFVITPHSPIGAKMIGRRAGDLLPAPAGRSSVRIVSVR
jgi:hypothetical protein